MNFTEEEKNLKRQDIFIQSSNYSNNDDLIKYHILKNKIFEYKCYDSKCPTKNGKWKRKDLYLIVKRINGKVNDLRIKNIILICPNCYFQNKSQFDFEEFRKNVEKKCASCNYMMNKKYKGDYCYVCTQKMNSINLNLTSNEYIDLTSSVISDSMVFSSITSNIIETKDNLYNVMLELDNKDTDKEILYNANNFKKYDKTKKKNNNKINSQFEDLPFISLNTDFINDKSFIEQLNKI